MDNSINIKPKVLFFGSIFLPVCVILLISAILIIVIMSRKAFGSAQLLFILLVAFIGSVLVAQIRNLKIRIICSAEIILNDTEMIIKTIKRSMGFKNPWHWLYPLKYSYQLEDIDKIIIGNTSFIKSVLAANSALKESIGSGEINLHTAFNLKFDQSKMTQSMLRGLDKFSICVLSKNHKFDLILADVFEGEPLSKMEEKLRERGIEIVKN